MLLTHAQKAARPSQRPFLGKDVARREFGRTAEGQIFAESFIKKR